MFGIEKDFQKLMEQVYGPLKRNKMTNMKEKADKVFSVYYDSPYHDLNLHLAATLREVINQLQQSPGVIMCSDLLELCEEIENL